jgi:mannose-6-phosphate isomerase-like protein (cupin superfamily)
MATIPQERATARAADIDSLPSLYDGLIKLARSALDITAFGVQVIDLPPSYTTDSHDESASGQEELYVALSGSGGIVLEDESIPVAAGRLVVVPPECSRRLASGAEGLRVLVVGSTPGQPYEPAAWTEVHR